MMLRSVALAWVVVVSIAFVDGRDPGGQTVVPAGATVGSSTPPTRGTGAISGVVTDAITGHVVQGAVVSLTRSGGPDSLRTLTDARGRFVFTDLAPFAGYYLTADASGYPTSGYGWTSPGGSTRDFSRVPLADGQWVGNIAIPMRRLGAISGRVVDESGEPAVGTTVRVYSTASIAGHLQPVAGALATTDDRGVYRLVGLLPGRYAVAVLSVQSTVLDTTPDASPERAFGELVTGGVSGSGPSSVSAPTVDVDGRHRLVVTNFATPPPPAAAAARVYPAVFFPGVRTVAEATAIEISFGDDRTGVDLALVPVPAVRVSGRLQGLTGQAPPLLLRLLPAGGEQLGVGSEAATTLVEPDGRFTFLLVPTGTYTILAQASVPDFTTSSATIRLPDAPGFPGGLAGVAAYESAPGIQNLQRYGAPSEYWGRASLAVGNSDITDVVVPVHPTVSIRGRAVFANGTPPPPATRPMVVNAFPADGTPTLGTPIGTTETDGTFRFTLSGLLGGTYLVRGFAGFGIVSMIWEGRDVLETGLDASSERDINDVVVTLTDQRIALNGFVGDPRGRADAAVLLFPAQRERWTDFGLRPLRFRTTRTNAGGGYQFSTLTAGDYFVIALEPSKINAWVVQAFLEAAAPLATRITLKWGDTASQDLTVKNVVVK